MLRIILAGCHGRMGQQVADLCAERSDLLIAAGLDRTGRPADGFPVFSDPEDCGAEADVLVDFSRPDALVSLLNFCTRRRLPAVLAVTGYSKEQLAQIRVAAHVIPIFRAANLSLGANVLLRLTQLASAVLGPDYDAAITERHHRNKLDAPSGTALQLADGIRPAPTGLFSIRAGSTAGEHTVLFAGQDEVLELTHRADSRRGYAIGAVKATQCIVRVENPGLYGMEDLLK